MDPELRQRLVQFVKPLYQDLDAVSHFEDVERVSSIARQLHTPATAEERLGFELLLVFHGLRGWLERVGNISRTALIVGSGLSETHLRQVLASLKRLDAPQTAEERALASALFVDQAGVRGLVSRLLHARREGTGPTELARELLASSVPLPEWLVPAARPWVIARWMNRRMVCEELLRESSVEDLA
jgi:hypothetical protein